MFPCCLPGNDLVLEILIRIGGQNASSKLGPVLLLDSADSQRPRGSSLNTDVAQRCEGEQLLSFFR